MVYLIIGIVLLLLFFLIFTLLHREEKNDPKKIEQLLNVMRLISDNIENQWLVGDTLNWWKSYRGFPQELTDLKIQIATNQSLRKLKEVIKTKKYLLYNETPEKLMIYFNRERKDTIVIYKEKKKPTLVSVDFYCIPTGIRLQDYQIADFEDKKAKISNNLCEFNY